MPSSPERPRVSTIGIASLVLISVMFAGWFYNLSARYPYNFMWDMDLLSASESLNINSGLSPHAISHPGTTMFMPQAVLHRFGYTVGLFSILTMDDLDNALSPLSAMAELTGFFRRLSAVAVFIVIFSLTAAFGKLFNLRQYHLWMILGVLGTLPGLSSQAAFVRVELYSILYLSLAWLSFALGYLSKNSWKRIIWYLVTGFFIGCCLLAKYQGIFVIAVFLWLSPFCLLVRPNDAPDDQYPNTTLSRWLMIATSIALLITSLTVGYHVAHMDELSWLESVINIPMGNRRLTPVGWVFFSSLIALPIVHFVLLFSGKSFPLLSAIFSFVTLIFVGSILSMFAPFLLYSNPNTGLHVVLAAAAEAFFTRASSYYGPEIGLDNLFQNLRFSPFLFVAFVLSSILLSVSIRRHRLNLPQYYLVLIPIVMCIPFAALILGLRPILRDLVWVETLLLIPTIVQFACAIYLDGTECRTVSRFFTAVLVSLLLSNVVQLPALFARVDAAVPIYGHSTSEFYGTFFTTDAYNETMETHYPKAHRPNASAKARQYWRDRRTVNSLFRNLNIGFDSLGYAYHDWPIWKDKQQWRISDVDDILLGSIIVDTIGLPRKSRYFFRENLASNSVFVSSGQKLDSIMPLHGLSSERVDSIPLSIITQRDTNLYLFVSKPDRTRLLNVAPNLIVPKWSPGELTLTVSNGRETKKLYGFEIQRYLILSLQNLEEPYIFLIQERAIDRKFF